MKIRYEWFLHSKLDRRLATGPDVLQQLRPAGAVADDAEGGVGRDPFSSEVIAPMWQTSSLKPNHSSTAFWANPFRIRRLRIRLLPYLQPANPDPASE